MQLAARMEMKDYIHLARAISLLLAIGYTFGVRKGRGQDPVRRDEKTKSVVKSVSSQTSQQPPIQPTKPTNQSKKKTSRAQGGEQRIY
jgi:hypothetical protein